jgi:hypothetical protein
MMVRSIRVSALALLAVLTLAVGLPVSTAAHATSLSDPPGWFTLSITSATSGELIAGAFLTCMPAGGSHPHPGAACDQLRQADGRIENIPGQQGVVCTKEFAPVIVAASGRWRLEPRDYQETFPNRCHAIAATGGVVFAF